MSIEELETGLCALIKTDDHIEHLESIRDGKLFMRPLKYSQGLENKRGDKQEGDALRYNFMGGSMRGLYVKPGRLNYYFIFCTTAIEREDIKKRISNPLHTIFHEKNQDFGRYSLIIHDVKRSFDQIQQAYSKSIEGKTTISGNSYFMKVGYYDEKENFNLLKKPESALSLKSKEFESENELRLSICANRLLNAEETFTFDIGSLKDISCIIPSSKVNDYNFDRN